MRGDAETPAGARQPGVGLRGAGGLELDGADGLELEGAGGLELDGAGGLELDGVGAGSLQARTLSVRSQAQQQNGARSTKRDTMITGYGVARRNVHHQNGPCTRQTAALRRFATSTEKGLPGPARRTTAATRFVLASTPSGLGVSEWEPRHRDEMQQSDPRIVGLHAGSLEIHRSLGIQASRSGGRSGTPPALR